MDRVDECVAAVRDRQGVPDGGPLPVAELRRMIEAHPPADQLERRSIDAFLDALAHLARPYDEHADPTHVTASAVIVGARGTVLHVHRRLGRWLQPGGHIDDGEAPSTAALRESIEETGLALAHPPAGPLLLHVDVHPAAGGHRHLDLRYLLVGSDDDPAPPPGESPEVRWFDWDDAIALADDGLATALRRARSWAARDAEEQGPGGATGTDTGVGTGDCDRAGPGDPGGR